MHSSSYVHGNQSCYIVTSCHLACAIDSENTVPAFTTHLTTTHNRCIVPCRFTHVVIVVVIFAMGVVIDIVVGVVRSFVGVVCVAYLCVVCFVV